ncbi:hypothetical protein [Bacillus thuringiensis]|nr:hypothetical protein [Bacillus thuringiensis]EEM86269.1 hypothetical protein bthur0012_57290 [Bacillus thuringiensis serovar pulsiensis BGSC 4CC1]
MEQCTGCRSFLVGCPYRITYFCPTCRVNQGELETMEEDGDIEQLEEN